MKTLHWSLGVLVLTVAAATPSLAQSGPGPVAQKTVDSRTAHRQRLIDRLIGKWSNHLLEVYRQDPSAWVTQMAAPYDVDAMDVLERAVEAKTFTAMTDAFLKGETSTTNYLTFNADNLVGEKLGDLAADLVFVPITPCRILDTRVAGGTIAGNTVRNFDVTGIGNYSVQGGVAGDCDGTGAAGSFAAAAINFTVVGPVAAGYVTAFPYLATQPLAATVNYVAGDIRGNMAIIKLDQSAALEELSVYTLATTHLVGDMIGYFINPQATELNCVNTADTTVTIAAGLTGNAMAPSCSTGYTQTATNCESSAFQMPLVYNSNGVCSAQNNSGASGSLRASRTCCRVPGR